MPNQWRFPIWHRIARDEHRGFVQRVSVVEARLGGAAAAPLTPKFHRLDELPVADADVHAVFRCQRSAPPASSAFDAQGALVDRDPLEGEIGAIGWVDVAHRLFDAALLFGGEGFARHGAIPHWIRLVGKPLELVARSAGAAAGGISIRSARCSCCPIRRHGAVDH